MRARLETDDRRRAATAPPARSEGRAVRGRARHRPAPDALQVGGHLARAVHAPRDRVRTNSETLLGVRANKGRPRARRRGIAIAGWSGHRREHPHRSSPLLLGLRFLRLDEHRAHRRGRRTAAPARALDRAALPAPSRVAQEQAEEAGPSVPRSCRDAADRQRLRLRWDRPPLWPFKRGILLRARDQRSDPCTFPIAHEVAKRMAAHTGGIAQSSNLEIIANVPTTAHILGGCPMGTSAESGGHRRAVSRLRLRGSVRDRRLGHPRQFGREPEPDHHRARRVRDVAGAGPPRRWQVFLRDPTVASLTLLHQHGQVDRRGSILGALALQLPFYSGAPRTGRGRRAPDVRLRAPAEPENEGTCELSTIREQIVSGSARPSLVELEDERLKAIVRVDPGVEGALCSGVAIESTKVLTARHCTTLSEHLGVERDGQWLSVAEDLAPPRARRGAVERPGARLGGLGPLFTGVDASPNSEPAPCSNSRGSASTRTTISAPSASSSSPCIRLRRAACV